MTEFIAKSTKTVIRDIRAGIKFTEAFIGYKWRYYRNESLTSIFRKTVTKNANKTAIIFGSDTWTFTRLDHFSNMVGNYFYAQGFRPGDEVALLMNTCAEYIGIWLGLVKIGVIPAFINTNNRFDSLIDCFTALKCKAIIYGSDFVQAINEIYDKMCEMWPSMRYYVWTEDNVSGQQKRRTVPYIEFAEFLDPLLKRGLTIEHKRRFDDILLYVFTSGTTGGKAKAAIQTDGRVIVATLGQRITYRLKNDDNIYVTLPLHHAMGGLGAVAQSLLFGLTITLRKKFSAKHFWTDCIQNKCTVSMYIGEICRYLLAQPIAPEESEHSIRLMFGIGLRKEYWNQFRDRFAIKEVFELYASSESNMIMFNIDNTEGSCGFYPWYYGPFIRVLYPAIIIKVSSDTYEPVRNSKGLCKVIRPGDMGVIVGRSDFNDPLKNFKGYTDPKETEKKYIFDVMKRGDKAFISGDLLHMDLFGNLYFKDRTGDTFRWKGENVSTTDVEAVLQTCLGLRDCVVFGVSVGQCEGKAGMAVISGHQWPIDWPQLTAELVRRLPPYAIPLFIRITDSVETTNTYKPIKYKLKTESFDPNVTTDRIYFFDKDSNQYIPLDDQLYKHIQSDITRL